MTSLAYAYYGPTHYNFLVLMSIILNLPMKKRNSFVCSQLQHGGYNFLKKLYFFLQFIN